MFPQHQGSKVERSRFPQAGPFPFSVSRRDWPPSRRPSAEGTLAAPSCGCSLALTTPRARNHWLTTALLMR